MATYTPPLRDMQFIMHEVLNVMADLQAMPVHAEIDADTINAVLEEGGKFASEVLLPLNISGDTEGCTYDAASHAVSTPAGYKEAYAQYVDSGWAALSCEPEFGGQGLPLIVNQCFYEMMNSANQARLPDAPPGIKGVSLFIVPKFLVNADGSLGARNGIYCGGLEHKMGIKSNVTAQIVLDGAVGTLVGQPNKGMQGMFVMMNAARLGVGNQSLGLTEVAFQNALAYAKDRIQMRSLTGPKATDKPADPILVHPDVRRMLLTAKAYAEGGRALMCFSSMLLEKEHHHPDEAVRKESGELLAMLTPIVKAFITDNGWAATSGCLQVFGGHGYIKEWGMEQFVRDARINMIYEGTNTIQSLDLLGRKILGNNGATLKKFGKLIGTLVAEEGVNEKMAEFITPIAMLGEQMTKFTTEIGFKGFQNPDEVGAAAVDYLRVAGHLVFGYFWARMAQVALRQIAAGNTDPFYVAKLQTARFYFAKLFPETTTLMRTARTGSKVLMDTDAALA